MTPPTRCTCPIIRDHVFDAEIAFRPWRLVSILETSHFTPPFSSGRWPPICNPLPRASKPIARRPITTHSPVEHSAIRRVRALKARHSNAAFKSSGPHDRISMHPHRLDANGLATSDRPPTGIHAQNFNAHSQSMATSYVFPPRETIGNGAGLTLHEILGKPQCERCAKLAAVGKRGR